MSDTQFFGMPLLDAAQAQKHVTVNQALTRCDALGARRVESRSLVVPPASPLDGAMYLVPASATLAWAGQDDRLALFSNGGWEFIAPWDGAQYWVGDEAIAIRRTGGTWTVGHLNGSVGGATTTASVVEFDHALSAGSTSLTAAIIPTNAVVLGVTARVTSAISGASTWSIGVSGSPNRYGTMIGAAVNSTALGVTGQPQAYYSDTEILISADNGAFTGGNIRIAVHLFEVSPPIAV